MVAQAGDQGPLLLELTAVAVDWRPGIRIRQAAQVLASADLAHYALGWPTPGERGLVAQTADGTDVGAAWWRCFRNA